MPYLQSLSWVNPKSRPHCPLPTLLPSTPPPVKSLYAKLHDGDGDGDGEDDDGDGDDDDDDDDDGHRLRGVSP